ncbi:hypothetical protein I316_05354 [Kwoniella heveanensis BCC8398]|uniref:Uncharacterized protein n=1 Tax=Kwoniella heveanensis BCC8398 TaxID=1296120 RepID=A0A1B9GPT4_9TREE|nr:hypothetical protein I316_05354 [Kwoniella heveanensis BCC8398]
MPPTATRGSRNKFYNRIAADARRAQTLVLSPASPTGSQAGRSGQSRPPSLGGSYGYSYRPIPSSQHGWPRAGEGDEGGWGGAGNHDKGGVRASALKAEDPKARQVIDSARTTSSTFSPHLRIQDWVNATTPSHRHIQGSESFAGQAQDLALLQAQPPSDRRVDYPKADSYCSHPQSPSSTGSTPTQPIPSKKNRCKGDDNSGKMEEDQLSAFQRFMARSRSPFPSASRRRDPHLSGGVGAWAGAGAGASGDRNSYAARSKYPDITSPVPVLNLPIRERWAENRLSYTETRRKKLEKDKQQALQMLQEAERELEEEDAAESSRRRRPHVDATLAQENADLRDELKHYKETLRQAQAMLENQQTQSSSEASQAARDHERLTQQIEDLQFALSKAEAEADTERHKRSKAELESESSKKGQSTMARAAHEADLRAKESEAKVKELEGKLKECERRETIERERRNVAERKVAQQAAELTSASRNLEIHAQRVQEAYNAKDLAIQKLRAVNVDSAKLHDKLNTVRLENDSIRARVDELTGQLQSAEAGAADRKRLKKDAHKERATADRLRAERNDLKEQLAKLAVQARRLKASRAHFSRYDLTDLGTDIERPRSSVTLHKKRAASSSFAQAASVLLHKSGTSSDRTDPRATTTVISDPDGEDLPIQRVVLEDESEELKTGEGPARIEETQAFSSEKASLELIKKPSLSMASIPLEPTRITPNLLGPEFGISSEIHQNQKKPAGPCKTGASERGSDLHSALDTIAESMEMKRASDSFGLLDNELKSGASPRSGPEASVSGGEVISIANGGKAGSTDPSADIGAEFGFSLVHAQHQPPEETQSPARLV